MAQGKIVREPGEPRPGDEVPWIEAGMGARVVRVARARGRWTRVRVEWQLGCMPVPLDPDDPASEWACPADGVWFDRATFEEQARRWRESRGG